MFDTRQALLTIAGRTLRLPGFLKDVMAEEDECELKPVSSWIHDFDKLPPYASINIAPRGGDFSYGVLVNMDEMEILKIELSLKDTHTVTRQIPVDPVYWRGEGADMDCLLLGHWGMGNGRVGLLESDTCSDV